MIISLKMSANTQRPEKNNTMFHPRAEKNDRLTNYHKKVLTSNIISKFNTLKQIFVLHLSREGKNSELIDKFGDTFKIDVSAVTLHELFEKKTTSYLVLDNDTKRYNKYTWKLMEEPKIIDGFLYFIHQSRPNPRSTTNESIVRIGGIKCTVEFKQWLDIIIYLENENKEFLISDNFRRIMRGYKICA